MDLSSTDCISWQEDQRPGKYQQSERPAKAHNFPALPIRTSILANLVPKTMSLLTKFPYNKEGHPHWDAMKQLFNMGAHESYTGASYYEEHEIMMEALEMAMFDEDRPWCLEYTKEAFVKGWNKTKKQYEFWQLCGQRI